MKELVENNSYTKTGFMALLKAILSDLLKFLIDGIKYPNRAIEKINNLKYNENFGETLQNKLRSTKEINYFKIDEYYVNIKSFVSDLSKCNIWNGNETKFLLDSKFKENLTRETRMKIRENKKFTSEEILKYIRTTGNGLSTGFPHFNNKKKQKDFKNT
ncbi:hypothetical protein DMUE_2443 [Dictyocoela muelleri]|nr:hypothetical protein DMUE_2443 [Dictyocoela muelleri]